MAKHPQMDWGHLSLDADLPDYKGGWRGASPVVEIVSLIDRDAERLTRPTRDPKTHDSHSPAQVGGAGNIRRSPFSRKA